MAVQVNFGSQSCVVGLVAPVDGFVVGVGVPTGATEFMIEGCGSD